MICSYCQSENSQYVENCGFCDAPLNKQRPQIKEFIYLELCERRFSDLSLFHTYDLLILLRLVREERSKSYNLMRSVQKAPDGVVVDSDTRRLSESEYRRYTARMKVIEGILIDRMGYKPKRVDDKLLESLRKKVENG
jgi:hypothetical protein